MILGYVLVGMAAGSIGLYFRLFPLFFYTGSEASEKATLLVISQLKKTAAQEVAENLQPISPYEKNSLIKKRFDQLLHNERDHVRKTIDRLAKQLEEESSQKHPPYLLESDSYNYLNLTENIIRTGKISDEIKASKYFNKWMMAPVGFYEPLNLHPYVGYGVYKIAKFFNPQIPLITALGFTSLVVAMLALTAFILVCITLGCGPLVTFVSSVFFLLAPVFIKRSCFGWYDADPYNIFFPLMILFTLFLGLDNKSPRGKIICAAAGALLMLAYTFFWQGGVYLFAIIMVSGAAIVFYNHVILKKFDETKNLVIYFLTFLLITSLSVGLTFGIEDFFVLFQEGWKALREFLAPPLSLWPDMYVSVGELRKAGWVDICEFTGGIFFLAVAGLGFIHYTIQCIRSRHSEERSDEESHQEEILRFTQNDEKMPSLIFDPFKMITIAAFFFSSLLLTLGAQRFVLLFIIPLSLLFALGARSAFDFLTTNIEKRTAFLESKTVYLKWTVILIFLSLIFIPLQNAQNTTLSLLDRIFNETWEKVLKKIDQETPPESIVNSWWPPGHFIKAIAHRRVTFDGATINKPQAYWMANVFLNSDERKALGILRMLNDSANLATDYLQSLKIDLSKTVDILKRITPLNKEDARNQLTGLLQPDQIDHLLELTHKTPPPSYLLIYNELIEKNLVLSFVDRWNFKKIEQINRNPQERKLIPRRKSAEYIKFLWNIAGGPLNYSEVLTQLGRQNNTLIFEQGIQLDLDRTTCRINSKKFGKGIPKSLIFLKNGQVVNQKLAGGKLGLSVVLFEENGRTNCMVMDERLANSILIKLYFFDGKGLKYFRPFTQESDLTRRTRIFVYEINWKEFLKDTAGD